MQLDPTFQLDTWGHYNILVMRLCSILFTYVLGNRYPIYAATCQQPVCNHRMLFNAESILPAALITV